MVKLRLPRLYAIVDTALSPSPIALATSLFSAGVRLIQLRGKKSNSREMYSFSLGMQEAARRSGAIFIVNDRADIAWAAGADGVHLGQDDLPAEFARRMLPEGMMIGVSTHTVEQVARADQSPADYIAFGPIFATNSKEAPDPVVGLSGLTKARRITPKPLVAIGGITADNAPAVIAAGADSVAVIGALLGEPGAVECAKQAQKLLAILSTSANHVDGPL